MNPALEFFPMLECHLDAVAAAGFAGVEFSNNMIGEYLDRPEAFQKANPAPVIRARWRSSSIVASYHG